MQRESYEKTRIPMLPVVLGVRRASKYILLNTLLRFTISVLLYFTGPFGLTYMAASLGLGAIFVYWNLKLIANASKTIAWENYKFSGVYLVMLLSVVLVDVMR